MVDLCHGEKGEINAVANLGLMIKNFRPFEVVHHLPGRLRLYIPLLEGLPSDWLIYKPDLLEIIKLWEGIVDIELSVISGRALICYDSDLTNQAQILQWLKTLALLFYGVYMDAPFESKQQIAPFLKKMVSKSRHLLQRKRRARKVA